MTPGRLFYVQAAGWPIRTHLHWRQGLDDPTQVSITFSSQVESVAQSIGADLTIIAANPDGETLRDGAVTIEHWRKPGGGSGVRYYLAELRYALRLIARARSARADLALLDSGVLPYFLMALFRLAGIPVVVILHTSLWPAGFPPQGRRRWLLRLDRFFFRKVARGVIAVSPEIKRQLRQLAGDLHVPVMPVRAQFRQERFAAMPAPDATRRPFRMVFAGRMVAEKGVLDLPAMARHVEDRAPGLVHWTLCGGGESLEEVRARVAALGVGHVMDVRGWTAPEELERLYGQCHAAIVPTRSSFAEGLAMTAVEPILAGRPLVSNPVVPAIELVAPATIVAATDDVASHADAVLALASDPDLYHRLCAACPALGSQFYDREQGLAAVLARMIAQVTPG